MSDQWSVRLVDWRGDPVARCPVTLWQGDVEVGRGLSDENGVAVVRETTPLAGRAPLSPELREALEAAHEKLAFTKHAVHIRSFLSVSTGGTWCCQSCGEEFSEDPGSGHTVAVDDGRGNPIPERCGPVSWKSVAVSTEGK